MPHQFLHFPGPVLELLSAAETALSRVPPAFPLTATVAVNPYLGHIHDDRVTVASRIALTTGCRSFASRADFAQMLADGRIKQEHLAATLAGQQIALSEVADALSAGDVEIGALPSVADLAKTSQGADWSDLVADRIGTWAAGHFDQGQAFWPTSGQSAYAAWRGFARRDLTPGIAGLGGFSGWVADLPDEPRVAFAEACKHLQLAPNEAELYFQRLLASLSGWAHYAQGLGWADRRDGGHTSLGFELLTIRTVWDALIYRAFADTLAPSWAEARAKFAAQASPARDIRIDAALQDALELSAEAALVAKLNDHQPPEVSGDRPLVQIAFCIDVRSEVMRRALEAADSGVETIGFAGFFGLPIQHRGPASDVEEARAPVLLAPAVDSAAVASPDQDFAQRIALRGERAWRRFKGASVSAFAFVEAAGPVYFGKLLRDSLGITSAAKPEPEPVLDLSAEDRIAVAAKILRAMSLTTRFGRLVVFCGHGAKVTNSPHASALQCGACGGHSGEVNARALAGLLNDANVRAGLHLLGIEVPADTVFVGALHDTVSDDITLFVPHGLVTDEPLLSRFRTALSTASRTARAERMKRIPVAASADALRGRGADWSETRPEWGLAGCAAFVAAPRHRTVGLDLSGRAFLHDYDWRKDAGFGVLELILTAPVVVASWISLQYYGSAVAPAAFGAGNKLLHNVVGGFGVLEGASQTLRIGLPFQTWHDGCRSRHEPLRLSVVIKAPRQEITTILDRHRDVKALFDNGWLGLFAMDDNGVVAWRHHKSGWMPVEGPTALPHAA